MWKVGLKSCGVQGILNYYTCLTISKSTSPQVDSKGCPYEMFHMNKRDIELKDGPLVLHTQQSNINSRDLNPSSTNHSTPSQVRHYYKRSFGHYRKLLLTQRISIYFFVFGIPLFIFFNCLSRYSYVYVKILSTTS